MFNTPTDLDAALQALGGVACAKAGTTFWGLLNAPDFVLEQGAVSVGVQSREFQLTYRTSAVALAARDSLTVAGTAYVVRDPPRQIDDGALSIARLALP